jgi:hypothetical protein
MAAAIMFDEKKAIAEIEMFDEKKAIAEIEERSSRSIRTGPLSPNPKGGRKPPR